jgi:hypothetical protein
MTINRLLSCFNLSVVFKNTFCSWKPRFLLQIDLSGNTFSVAPSMINENAKNALFHCGMGCILKTLLLS